jgi:glutamine synthetase type III
LKAVGVDVTTAPERKTLDSLSVLTIQLQGLLETLTAMIDGTNAIEEASEQAEYASKNLTSSLEDVRIVADKFVFPCFVE